MAAFTPNVLSQAEIISFLQVSDIGHRFSHINGYTVALLTLGLTMIATLCIVGCRSESDTPTPSPTQALPMTIQLPPPREQGEMSLEQAIAQRRSVRAFTEQKLTQAQLSQLLWAAQGITDPRGFRAAPSAGALYPLELYVVSADGFYHYQPKGHKLMLLVTEDMRQAVWRAGLKQDALRDAPAVFLIAAVYQRTAVKYGERAERYVKLEAGHAAQNLLLQAVALGLGGGPIGAFYDDQLQAALSLPGDHAPLYLVPVGYPEE
jgi:SagB-type dehydrogenase family enzyme